MRLQPLLISNFIRSYWITMRPYLLFVSGITGLCGVSFGADISFQSTLLLLAAFYFSYGFGQALTDCFQMDTDSLSSPYRPLVQGIIKKTHVMIVSLIGLAGCGIILGLFSWKNLLLALLCVFGLSTYTYFKKRWWGGPWYNAWIVVVLFFMGFQSASIETVSVQWLPFMCTIISVFFGYANFVLTGYFKDVEADRSTGYNTIVVVYGRSVSSAVSNVFALLFTLSGIIAVIMILFQRPFDFTGIIPVVMLITALYFSWLSQFNLRQVTDDRQSYIAIVPCVHSYIVMFIAIAAANKPSWAMMLVLFTISYFWTIQSRPDRSQI